jgi:hypothetical protein
MKVNPKEAGEICRKVSEILMSTDSNTARVVLLSIMAEIAATNTSNMGETKKFMKNFSKDILCVVEKYRQEMEESEK